MNASSISRMKYISINVNVCILEVNSLPATNVGAQVEILLRSCKILQESCKILIKIKILIRSCLTVKILKDLSKNLVRS